MLYIVLMTLFTTSLIGFIGTVVCAYIYDCQTDIKLSNIATSVQKINSMSSAFRMSFMESSKK